MSFVGAFVKEAGLTDPSLKGKIEKVQQMQQPKPMAPAAKDVSPAKAPMPQGM